MKVKIDLLDWKLYEDEKPPKGTMIQIIDDEGLLHLGEIEFGTFGKFKGYILTCTGYNRLTMSTSLIKYWKLL